MRDDIFEWDDAKAASNARKHGVTFDDAREVFGDRNAMEEPDDDPNEERWRTTGLTRAGVLVVISTERGARIRIISAREANRHEQDDDYRHARP
jgi:uncharacterized protein